jgi:hypothetical protein
MDLKMVVSLSLLCTDVEWDNVCRIRTLVSDATLSPSVSTTIAASVQEPITEGLSDGERHLMDAMSQETHENGSTPLMDLFESAPRRPGRKPNTTSIPSLAAKFLSEKREAPRDEIVEYVKFYRPDLTDKQVQNNLYIMRYNKRITTNDNGMWALPITVQ